MTHEQLEYAFDSLQNRFEQSEARVEKLVTDMNSFRELAIHHLEQMAEANKPKETL